MYALNQTFSASRPVVREWESDNYTPKPERKASPYMGLKDVIIEETMQAVAAIGMMTAMLLACII